MRIQPFYDQSEVIDRTTATVLRNLIEGCILVILILVLFLRDLRASLIVAAVIPVSMLVGFIGMRLFGVSANLMSLGAIDFGLIVDGAVVMMENFVRRRSHAERRGFRGDRPARDGRLDLFKSAAAEVARPVLFGVLIIIAVYLPIFTLEGLEGKMFRPMAITVCSALLGSLLLSLTAVPVVSSYLLKMGGHHEDRLVRPPARPLHHAPRLPDAAPFPHASVSRWRWSSSPSARCRSSAPSSCRSSTRARSSSRRASCPRCRSRSPSRFRAGSSGSSCSSRK